MLCLDSEDEFEGLDHESRCLLDEDFHNQHLFANLLVGEDDEIGMTVLPETCSTGELLNDMLFTAAVSDGFLSSGLTTLGFSDHWLPGTSSSQEEYNSTFMRTNSAPLGVVLDSTAPHNSQEISGSFTGRHIEPATSIYQSLTKNCEQPFFASFNAPPALHTACSGCRDIDDDLLDSRSDSEGSGLVSIHSDSDGHGIMDFGDEGVKISSEPRSTS
ncbi:unnamed protein product [Cyclocybe aegerita]|uniref:Uncharacterized protein n=1 Tax=Cyclocybe aegerita TaxID=1973307 RepID=A0A8S0W8L3_CYCAE|nr:unnamed protein product [Cyclocybe aegerita]